MLLVREKLFCTLTTKAHWCRNDSITLVRLRLTPGLTMFYKGSCCQTLSNAFAVSRYATAVISLSLLFSWFVSTSLKICSVVECCCLNPNCSGGMSWSCSTSFDNLFNIIRSRILEKTDRPMTFWSPMIFFCLWNGNDYCVSPFFFGK